MRLIKDKKKLDIILEYNAESFLNEIDRNACYYIDDLELYKLLAPLWGRQEDEIVGFVLR